MNLKKILILAGVSLAIIVLVVKFARGTKAEEETLLQVQVEKGLFENVITASGELRAENNVAIEVPNEILRGRVRIFEIKITDLIEEGTYVDSGDYVASLDHSAVMEMIETETEALQGHYDNFENAKMDTNLNLTNARNDLMTDEDGVEEQRIILEQSIYESPSVQRQAQMNLEKAIRRLEQNKRSYELNVRKSEQRMVQIKGYIKRSQDAIDEYKAIFESLNIKAPKKGMFIYARDRFGNKLQVGTMVSRWHPIIAELPDMSSMVSRTYVNEVDISKIKEGQKVNIGIDAFPGKAFNGEVIAVSNMGQSIDNKTKVFEVDIRLLETDSLLKPAMTTSNSIETTSIENALYLPSDAIFHNDSLSWIYPLHEKEKRIVVTGEENENYTVVLEGADNGDKVYLLPPEEAEDFPWANLDLYKGKEPKTEITATINPE